jgi:hypothetical protein
MGTIKPAWQAERTKEEPLCPLKNMDNPSMLMAKLDIFITGQGM